jgi:cytochrome c biogenesis protein CcmG/thiol:disulfide interchange protein DsbE
VAINWGVYGFPETFIIKDGVIRYKHAGPIMQMQFEDEFMPILESIRQ